MPISSATRLLCLLGDPVSHSLSPGFQNAGIAAMRLDAVYLALRCGSEDVNTLIRGIARAGGGGNITVPHKERAVAALDRATEAVRRTGACNTFWSDDGAVCGDNTDVVGFREAVRTLLGRAPSGLNVLLLGSGGSARAAVDGLLQEGAGTIVLTARSPDRAAMLRDQMPEGADRIELRTREALRGERFDLVVNATPLGLRDDDPLPLREEEGIAFGAALDLVYRPERTRWVRGLRAAGRPADDGLEMLIRQGAAAFEHWWGVPAPLEAMRAALPPR